MRLTYCYLLLTFITLFAFVACKKEENFTSRIHFFNGVIGGQPISIKAGTLAIADNISYDTLKANTIISSGTFDILFNGGQLRDSLLTNLAANETYTIVAYDSAKRASIFMRKDVMPATPGFGRCAVRIYNLIPGSSSLFLGKFIDTAGRYKDTAKFYITGKTFNDFAGGTTSPAFVVIDTITRPRIYTGDTTRLTPVLPPLLPGKIYTFYLTGSIKDTVALHPKCIIQVHN